MSGIIDLAHFLHTGVVFDEKNNGDLIRASTTLRFEKFTFFIKCLTFNNFMHTQNLCLKSIKFKKKLLESLRFKPAALIDSHS